MWRPPGGAVPEHSVEDDEQLAHAGHQRHLLGFTGAYQPLVERLYSRVAAGGHQGTHVQRRPHPWPTAPDGALASKDARVTVLKGATPTRAASCLFLLSAPSSGSSANSASWLRRAPHPARREAGLRSPARQGSLRSPPQGRDRRG